VVSIVTVFTPFMAAVIRSRLQSYQNLIVQSQQAFHVIWHFGFSCVVVMAFLFIPCHPLFLLNLFQPHCRVHLVVHVFPSTVLVYCSIAIPLGHFVHFFVTELSLVTRDRVNFNTLLLVYVVRQHIPDRGIQPLLLHPFDYLNSRFAIQQYP